MKGARISRADDKGDAPGPASLLLFRPPSGENAADTEDPMASRTLRSLPPISALLLAVAGFGATLGPAAVSAKLSRTLASAVMRGDPEEASKALSRGADPNGWAGGETLVGRALGDGRSELVRLLLEHGADPNAVLASGETPLLRAVTARDLPMVRLLLDSGASANLRSPWGELPLHRAAAAGHPQIVELLLARGADPTALGPDARSAALVAAEASHRDVAARLARRTPNGSRSPKL
jgi:uncharacterized protein